jgi:hypothetical protein
VQKLSVPAPCARYKQVWPADDCSNTVNLLRAKDLLDCLLATSNSLLHGASKDRGPFVFVTTQLPFGCRMTDEVMPESWYVRML